MTDADKLAEAVIVRLRKALERTRERLYFLGDHDLDLQIEVAQAMESPAPPFPNEGKELPAKLATQPAALTSLQEADHG